MAIIKEVPGLELTVDVAGQDLQEYDDDAEEAPMPCTSTKYVEAASGATFGIATRCDPESYIYPDDNIRLKVALDGEHVCVGSHTPAMTSSGHRNVLDRTRKDLGDRAVIQKFSFVELQFSKSVNVSRPEVRRHQV